MQSFGGPLWCTCCKLEADPFIDKIIYYLH